MINTYSLNLRSQFSSGFTLLEVLIAIVITSLIGLGSWQLLNSAIRTNDLTHRSLNELSQLQKTMHFLSKDFEQIVPRAIRDEYGDYQAAVSNSNDFYTLEFTRLGWRNPLQDKRSELQRVAYELNDGELVRLYWNVLDRAQDSEPRAMLLLDRVESFKVSFLNDSDAWLDSWPPNGESSTETQDPIAEFAVLPKAFRFKLTHPKFGIVERLFDSVSYMENNLAQNGADDGSGSGSGSNNDNGNTSNSNNQGNQNSNGVNTQGTVDNGSVEVIK